MNETDCDAGVESMMSGAKFGLKISAFWWNKRFEVTLMWRFIYIQPICLQVFFSESFWHFSCFQTSDITDFFLVYPYKMNNSVRIMHRGSRTSLMAWNDMTFSRMLSVQQIYTTISTARPIIAISWHQKKNEMALPVFMTRRHEITYS